MTTLLHISASPRGQRSESLAIAASFLDELRATRPDVTVEHWDLWDGTLPDFGPPAVAAKMAIFGGADPEGEEAIAWRTARETFERFDSADYYLFTVPMWNASVPYILKQLIDVISQPGMIFDFDPVSWLHRPAGEQAGRRHLHRRGLRPRPRPRLRQRLPAAVLRGLAALGRRRRHPKHRLPPQPGHRRPGTRTPRRPRRGSRGCARTPLHRPVGPAGGMTPRHSPGRSGRNPETRSVVRRVGESGLTNPGVNPLQL